MTLVEKKSRRAQFIAYALIGIMLASLGYGVGVWSAPVTSFGIDGSGNLAVNRINTNTVQLAGVDVTKTITEETASYVVWVDGATYYARNGHTGALHSDADAVHVIQTALNDASAGTNGVVFLKAGSYTLTSWLTVPSGCSLRGESATPWANYGTKLIGYDSTILILNTDASVSNLVLLNYVAATTNPSTVGKTINIIDASTGLIIDDVFVLGGEMGIYGRDLVNLDVERSTFSNQTYGIWIVPNGSTNNMITLNKLRVVYSTTMGIGLTSCRGATLTNSIIEGNLAQPLQISAGYDYDISGNWFEDNGHIDILVTGNAQNVVIKNNVMVSNNAGRVGSSEIKIDNADYVLVENNVDLLLPPVLSLEVVAGCTNVSSKQNQFMNGDYITENSGTATLLNGQNHVHVTHGLSVTPLAQNIHITFTEIPTNASTGWYIGGCSSTEFIFYENDPGASNLDFGWDYSKTP
jgi:hypothetical protein